MGALSNRECPTRLRRGRVAPELPQTAQAGLCVAMGRPKGAKNKQYTVAERAAKAAEEQERKEREQARVAAEKVGARRTARNCCSPCCAAPGCMPDAEFAPLPRTQAKSAENARQSRALAAFFTPPPKKQRVAASEPPAAPEAAAGGIGPSPLSGERVDSRQAGGASPAGILGPRSAGGKPRGGAAGAAGAGAAAGEASQAPRVSGELADAEALLGEVVDDDRHANKEGEALQQKYMRLLRLQLRREELLPDENRWLTTELKEFDLNLYAHPGRVKKRLKLLGQIDSGVYKDVADELTAKVAYIKRVVVWSPHIFADRFKPACPSCPTTCARTITCGRETNARAMRARGLRRASTR